MSASYPNQPLLSSAFHQPAPVEQLGYKPTTLLELASYVSSEKSLTLKHHSSSQLYLAIRAVGLDIRYNSLNRFLEIREANGIWKQINDPLEDRLKELIEFKCELIVTGKNGKKDTKRAVFPPALWRQCLGALSYQVPYDPVKDYISNLPEWDGVERLNNLLHTLWGAEGPLAEWASRYPFIGILQRTLEPGDKIDETPIIAGHTKSGKSAFAKAILWNPRDHFSDYLDLSSRTKEKVESIQNRLLVELGEMVGLTRAEVNSLKAFMTREDDGNVRLSYRRNPELMLRRYVMIGTANPETLKLPNDPSGAVSRRFVIVELQSKRCLKGSVEMYFEENREQLWAEATQLFLEGVRANLPHELSQMADDINDGWRNANIELEEALQDIEKGSVAGQMRSSDVKKLIEIKGVVTDQSLATAMQKCGWERVSRSRTYFQGKKANWWLPPEDKLGEPKPGHIPDI